MIIYEVNIKISPQIYKQYTAWLDNHISLMMKNNGFIKYRKYFVNKSNENLEICVHYYIRNISLYDEYVYNYSDTMRNDPSLDKFKNKYSISRRVLSKI